MTNDCVNDSRIAREKVLYSLLDGLYWLTDDTDINSGLYNSRVLIIDIMELLTNPAVSINLPGDSKAEAGKLLNRLQHFYAGLIENGDLQTLIDKHAMENYSEDNKFVQCTITQSEYTEAQEMQELFETMIDISSLKPSIFSSFFEKCSASFANESEEYKRVIALFHDLIVMANRNHRLIKAKHESLKRFTDLYDFLNVEKNGVSHGSSKNKEGIEQLKEFQPFDN